MSLLKIDLVLLLACLVGLGTSCKDDLLFCDIPENQVECVPCDFMECQSPGMSLVSINYFEWEQGCASAQYGFRKKDSTGTAELLKIDKSKRSIKLYKDLQNNPPETCDWLAYMDIPNIDLVIGDTVYLSESSLTVFTITDPHHVLTDYWSVHENNIADSWVIITAISSDSLVVDGVFDIRFLYRMDLDREVDQNSPDAIHVSGSFSASMLN